jgi:hypothetical protein
MVDKRANPMQWLTSHFPRNQTQLEAEFRRILRIVFWAALLAPVVIIPLYFLVVSLIH